MAATTTVLPGQAASVTHTVCNGYQQKSQVTQGVDTAHLDAAAMLGRGSGKRQLWGRGPRRRGRASWEITILPQSLDSGEVKGQGGGGHRFLNTKKTGHLCVEDPCKANALLFYEEDVTKHFWCLKSTPVYSWCWWDEGRSARCPSLHEDLWATSCPLGVAWAFCTLAKEDLVFRGTPVSCGWVSGQPHRACPTTWWCSQLV